MDEPRENTAASTSPSHDSSPRWRSWVGMILIVVGCLVAIPAVGLSWASKELRNTDTYVETVTPLLSNPEIRSALADKVTTAIFDHIDVSTLVDSGIDTLETAGLPPDIAQAMTGLSTPIEGAVRGFINREVLQIISSQVAARLWVEINTVAHEQLAAALSGQTNEVLRINGDSLIANTGVLSQEVKQRLVDSGFGLANLLPTINTNVTLLQDPGIATAQNQYQNITLAGTLLPWIAGILILAGIALSLMRVRATIIAGVGVAAAMALLAAGASVLRSNLPNAIPSNVLPASAASQAVDIVLRTLWRPIGFLFAVGIAVALIAFVFSSYAPAVQMRQWVQGAAAAARKPLTQRGWTLHPVDTWVRRAYLPAVLGVIAIAALTVALWSSPTYMVVVWSGVVAGLVTLVLTFLAAPAGEEPQSEEVTEEEPAQKVVPQTEHELAG